MIPPFTLFGRSHLLAVVTVAALIALAILRLQKHPPRVDGQRLNSWLGTLVLCNAVAWKCSDIMQGDFSLAEGLPFHVCGITPYLLAAYLWKPRQQLFDVLYYWVLGGASMALVFPDIEAGYPSREFVGFFITHGLPLFAMLYLVLVRNVTPSPKSYRTAFVALNFYALFIAGPVDLLTGGNYLYLRQVPEVEFGPIGLLPPWPLYLIPLELFALFLLRALYQPFHLQAKETELLPYNGGNR